MNILDLYKKVRKGQEVCVIDDFSEVATRVISMEYAYIKHKGYSERKVERTYETVMETIMNGKEVEKEEYNRY